jgi:hypothetical protein
VKRYPFLLLALTACAAHVTSSLQVDGTAFVPTTCRSGQARGFDGVKLADDQQRRLRLVAGTWPVSMALTRIRHRVKLSAH